MEASKAGTQELPFHDPRLWPETGYEEAPELQFFKAEWVEVEEAIDNRADHCEA